MRRRTRRLEHILTFGFVGGIAMFLACQPADPPAQATPTIQPGATNTPAPGATPTPAGGASQVSGKVSLPTGAGIQASGLKVLTGAGESAVAEDGSFTAALMLPSSGPTLLTVVDANDKLVLLGFVDPATPGVAELGPRQAAIALGWFALGAYGVPDEHFADLIAALGEEPAINDLANVVAARLTVNATALADGDQELIVALDAARESLLPDSPAAKARGVAKETMPRRAAENGNGDGEPSPLLALITPDATVQQSGIQVQQNPGGSGIIITNNFRRRAVALAYKTGYRDASGQDVTVEPPEFAEPEHPVPATHQLSLTHAVGEILHESAPWTPVNTAPFDLPLHPGAVRTYYDIIVLGPSFRFGETPPIMLDPRYAGVGGWDERLDELAWQTFYESFALPILQAILVGGAHHVAEGRLAAAVASFKSTFDPQLVRQGILLGVGWSHQLRELIQFLANGGIPNDIHQWLVNVAIAENADNAAALSAATRNLRALTSAIAITHAIEAAMTAADLVAVVHDLGSARKAEVWQVTVTQVRVRLEPSTGTVTQSEPAVTLTASVNGFPDASEFLYRWSTTGTHGHLIDSFNSGESFDSVENVVEYVADPSLITEGELDMVTVQVFEDDGSHTIHEGAMPIGQATSRIKGPVCREPDALINIPYAPLRNAVAAELGVDADEITCEDMGRLTSLNMAGIVNFGSGVDDPLEGLQYAVHLQSFNCNFCLIRDPQDFDLLLDLTELRNLNLGRTGIGQNMAALANLVVLENLDISETRSVTDLSALASLTNLRSINIFGTEVTSLNGLQNSPQLETINAGGGPHISDISALRGFVNVKRLVAPGGVINDITPLTSMAALEHLEVVISGNILEAGPLAGKPNLKFLDMPRAGEGDGLNDISALAGSTAMEWLVLNGHDINDISALAGMVNLVHLSLGGNRLSNLEPLRALTRINRLDLTNNIGITSIEPLSTNRALGDLYLDNTGVASLEPLLDTNIGFADTVQICCTPALGDTENIDKLRGRGVNIPGCGGNCP